MLGAWLVWEVQWVYLTAACDPFFSSGLSNMTRHQRTDLMFV